MARGCGARLDCREECRRVGGVATLNLKGEPTMFTDAESALLWATEIMRLRRWPKLSSIYNESVPDNVREAVADAEGERDRVAEAWQGEPLSGFDKYSMAQKVYKALAALAADEQRLLMLYAWGDYADEARLRAALAIQAQMRAEGKRVRLNYRYSYRQLGAIYAVDPKTVARRVRQALEGMGNRMAGLLVVPVEEGDMTMGDGMMV